MSKNEFVNIKNLHKSYGSSVILENLDFTLNKGEIIALMGYSGVGKTTFINILLGLDNDVSYDIMQKPARISCVFQEDRLLNWFNVYENIKLVNKELSKKEIFELLDVLNLKEYYDFYPASLSGGMKQRVSIARALAFESDLIIMDEPLKSTDKALGDEVLKYIKNLSKEKERSIIIVTHDMQTAKKIADKTLELNLKLKEIV